jgi:hypothetical protein
MQVTQCYKPPKARRHARNRASNTVLLTLLVAATGFAVAGCGGGKKAATTAPKTTAPPVTTTSGDPGRDAIEAFAAAARTENAGAMWDLLSTETRARLGVTLAHFRTHAAATLAKRLGSFGRFGVIVSERVTPEFGVVAIDGGRDVYAVALRLEGAHWKVELGGPVKVRPIGPDPGAREQVVAQIAGAVQGPGGTGTAVMYLDGLTEHPEVRGTATNSTLFANFDPALDPGRHTVVLFANDGREASATAWSFTVAKA